MKNGNQIVYRRITPPELTQKIFSRFIRRQKVTECLRPTPDGGWCVKEIAFTDDWSPDETAALAAELRENAESGGLVLGAFADGFLKGFVSVSPLPFGSRRQYLDLVHIYVSEELRGNGIGRRLFSSAAVWAKQRGAEKLYISAHSAVESQSFYMALGCIDTAEPEPAHIQKEPCDRQLEYSL